MFRLFILQGMLSLFILVPSLFSSVTAPAIDLEEEQEYLKVLLENPSNPKGKYLKSILKGNKQDIQVVDFGLNDFVRDVVRRNAGAIMQRIQRQISRHQVDFERGVFDTNFVFSIRRQRTNQPNDTQEALTRNFQSDFRDMTESYDMGYQGKWATGAEWSVKYQYNKVNSTVIDQFRSYDYEHKSGISLSLKYPLQKGKGKDVTLIKVDIAKLNSKIALDTYKKKLMDIVGTAIQTYWNMYGAQRLYLSWLTSVNLAQKELDSTRDRVRAGKSAKTEVLELESVVSSRKIELSEVRSKILQIQTQMNGLLGISSQSSPFLVFHMIEKPDFRTVSVPNLKQSFKEAIMYWPEYQLARKRLKVEKVKLIYAEDQLKPQLDLATSMTTNTLAESSSNALGKSPSSDHLSWYLGLEYSFPLGNRQAKSNMEIQDLRQRQAELELQALLKTLNNGLYDRIERLKVLKEQLYEYNKGFALKKKLFDVSRERFRFGKVPARVTFERQEKLILHERSLLNGLIEFQLARASLDKASGVLLRDFDVEIEEVVHPVEFRMEPFVRKIEKTDPRMSKYLANKRRTVKPAFDRDKSAKVSAKKSSTQVKTSGTKSLSSVEKWLAARSKARKAEKASPVRKKQRDIESGEKVQKKHRDVELDKKVQTKQNDVSPVKIAQEKKSVDPVYVQKPVKVDSKAATASGEKSYVESFLERIKARRSSSKSSRKQSHVDRFMETMKARRGK